MLPRSEQPLVSVLVPALVAAAWWAVLAMAQSTDLATQRSLVFLGGPLLLLSGLHGRLFGFLHAPERLALLVLPLEPRRHFESGCRSHRPALAVTTVLGVIAVVAAAWSGAGPVGHRTVHGLELVADFVWLAVFAWFIEPAIPAAASLLGRRFPEGSREHDLQRALGGGWTTPEAVVHLYAPALGIALAVALAMPGQLGLEHWIDRGGLSLGSGIVAVAPLVAAVAARAVARRAFGRGLWEAVPRLAEASRTIAGPPQPESTPRWIQGIRDPWARLLVVQFVRLTPLPMLRLVGLVSFVGWLAIRDSPPTGPAIAAVLVLSGLWLLPARVLARQRPSRARLGGALPIASGRSGRAGAGVGLLLLGPVALAAVAIGVRIAFVD